MQKRGGGVCAGCGNLQLGKLTPALGSLQQEDPKFEASLGSIGGFCLIKMHGVHSAPGMYGPEFCPQPYKTKGNAIRILHERRNGVRLKAKAWLEIRKWSPSSFYAAGTHSLSLGFLF